MASEDGAMRTDQPTRGQKACNSAFISGLECGQELHGIRAEYTELEKRSRSAGPNTIRKRIITYFKCEPLAEFYVTLYTRSRGPFSSEAVLEWLSG
jgi:hypothetical protein